MILLAAQTFHRFVQQIDMGYFQTSAGKTFPVYRIGMVLRGDLYFTCNQILYRMITAPVSEFQFVGFGSIRQRNDLVSQTDTENWILSPELPYQFNDRDHILRISRAIGKKNPVRMQLLYVFCCCVPWNDGHITMSLIQTADNIVLDPAIYSHDMIFWFFCRGNPARFRADLLYLICGEERAVQSGETCQIGGGTLCDQSFAGSFVADMPCQTACIYPGNSCDSMALHNLFQGFFSPEIGRLFIVFPDDQSADSRHFRFIVVSTDAIVANQRIGHNNGLPGVGRIRKDLLITNHGSVENHFNDFFRIVTETESIEFGSIFQDDLFIILPNHNCFLPFTKESFCSN